MPFTGLAYYKLSFRNHSIAVECLYLNKAICESEGNKEESGVYTGAICRILKHMDIELLKCKITHVNEPELVDKAYYSYLNEIISIADIIEEIEVLIL